MSYKRKTYTTEDEIEFIKQLKETKRGCLTRLGKLMNYSEALEKRVNWGEIDPVKIWEVINYEINKEFKKF
jgi:hypothetical protein